MSQNPATSQLDALPPEKRSRAVTIIGSILAVFPAEMRADLRHVLEYGGGFGGPGTNTPQMQQLFAELIALYEQHAPRYQS